MQPICRSVRSPAGPLRGSREETRTVDRKNYDLKVNFNRTTAHQLWGKYSFMDAVVDDLTNYLGLDPNADGDGALPRSGR